MAEVSSKVSADYSKLIREQTRQIDLDTFRERGLKKVSVINAKKINELIAQAVEATIQKLDDANIESLKEDKAQIVLDSMAEFRRLIKEQKEKPEPQESANNTQLSSIEDQLRDLKAFLTNLQAKSAQEQFTREASLEQEREILNTRFNELKEVFQEHAHSVQTAFEKLEARPGRIDSADLEGLMKSTIGNLKNEMMADFERSGLVKSGSGDLGGEVDTAVAESVISSVFDDIDTGTTESSLGRAASSQATGSSKQAMSALEKLKAMKKKKL